MQLSDILNHAQIADPPQCWSDCYDQANRAFPGEGFLTPDLVDLAARSTDLDPGFVDALRETVTAVRADDALLRLAWLWRVAYFEKSASGASDWPVPQALPEAIRGVFPVAVLITGLPEMLQMHRRMGVPDQVTRDTLYDIHLWAEHYRSNHGWWGFDSLNWLQHHFAGRLYRLERLEFVPITYTGDYRIYKGKADGKLIALAESGLRFRRDGHVDGSNGVTDPEAWESALEEGDGFVRGNVISADGRATREVIKIRDNQWDLLLKPGTNVLDVHIPTGSKLDYKACIDSYRMANEFFPRFFPEHKHAGFVCTSWLLDPELARILPETSNIVLFQREFYLLPVLSDDSQTFERVFGSRPADLAELPRATALQRAVLSHLLAGNLMCKRSGFIEKDAAGMEHGYWVME